MALCDKKLLLFIFYCFTIRAQAQKEGQKMKERTERKDRLYKIYWELVEIATQDEMKAIKLVDNGLDEEAEAFYIKANKATDAYQLIGELLNGEEVKGNE